MKIYSFKDFRELEALPVGTIFIFQDQSTFGVEIAGVARVAECYAVEVAEWLAQQAENLPQRVRDAIQRSA